MARKTLIALALSASVLVGITNGGAPSGASSGTIALPGRTDLIVHPAGVADVSRDGYTYRYFENRAYPCAISGYQSFAIGVATGSSLSAAAPLWVKMHGGGQGWFDDLGKPKPSAGNKRQESLSQLLAASDSGLTRLIRRSGAGFRVLLVSMCSHDIYAGVNSTDPHNPNLDAAGLPRTTNGLISVKAAIQYTRAVVPTTKFLLYGTSAGSAGALNVGWGLQRQGLAPAGLIADSGLINQEAELARVEQGTCGSKGMTLDSLTRSSARWAPEISDPANQPDLLVSNGSLTVPVFHLWNLGDSNTCGNTPMVCPLRDGSTPTLWSATCGHTPLSLAIAGLPGSRHSASLGVCVNASTTDGNPCDKHVVGLSRANRSDPTYAPNAPTDFIPVIRDWALARLTDS